MAHINAPVMLAAARRPLLLGILFFALSGCAVTQNVQTVETLESAGGQPTVLLMPPDIRYYVLTAGGVREPQAEWTEAARRNFSTAVQAFAADAGTEFEVLSDEDMTPTEVSYQKLHEAVGNAIVQHHFGVLKLPNKAGSFDWSLGPGVAQLAEAHDADYALFAFYRDQQASGGRMAIALLAAATVGAGMETNREFGFASLVDLRTGDVVWFNVVAAGSGELREAEGAQTAVTTLFKDMPSTATL